MRKNLLLLSAVLVASTALGQGAAGVSDERVVLPAPPGSIDGVGENATVSGNQGAMTYSVKIETPQGYEGLTPDLTLNYSSSGGASVAGIGWSMNSFSIQRMTSKGLQKYDTNDRFAANGGDELVKISASGGDAVYRARFEGTFVRWTWKNQGNGQGGYWKAEYPNGMVGYYGADKTGVEAPSSEVKVPTTSKVWLWHLVEMVDQFGHSMKLTWSKGTTGYPLLDRVEYLYEGTTARHSITLTYEARVDIISDATPGFELKLDKRLKDIRIFSGAEMIRSYVLAYEPETMSAGATRLQTVTRFGRSMAMYPVKFSFAYNKTLGGACDASCEKPFVRDMGTLGGVDFSQGKATLIDMNGDALPDVVFSPVSGNHQIFTSKLDTEGRSSFNMTPTTSAMATTSYVLGDPRTQVIDVNGDGFTDISRAGLGILCNNGSGDWVASSVCAGGISNNDPGASFSTDDMADATQADPKYVRFFDYDNDRRIDYLRTVTGGTTTEVLANTTSGFVSAPNIQNIAIGVFDDSPLQLADMNGDGMQDPVNVIASGQSLSLNYRVNLGFGQWGDAVTVTLSGLDASQVDKAELQDINGDGLADVVVVVGNEVRYALNRNGDRFDMVRVLANSDLGSGMIPTRGSTTVVVFADMNGNGSDDIVWIQPSGLVQYLELFPVRPNLISRIDNGIGSVQLVTYGTSLREQVRDAAANMPWANRVPNAYTLVTQIQNFVTLTGSDTGGLKEIENFKYHSGFYDGVEKQFRGYESLDREYVSDMSRDAQEPGHFVEQYDVGKTNPLFAGLQIGAQSFAVTATTEIPLRLESFEYQACPVADVTGAMPEPKFACKRALTTTLIERDMANAVTTKSEFDYDGYGNVTVTRSLGVTNLGTPSAPRACEACTASGEFGKPCGAMCLGDESFVEQTYAAPGTATSNAWIANRIVSRKSGSVVNAYTQEEQFFYDGPDFEGLPLGQLTKGAQSRGTRRNGPGANDFLTIIRIKRNADGSVVDEINANGSVSDTSNNRRLYTYDGSGLQVTSTEIKLGSGNSIKREYQWDTTWEKVGQASNWIFVSGGSPVGSPQLTKFRFDEHGRLIKILDPGDSETSPSNEFSFQLASPASRILSQQRSTSSGPADVIVAKCFDGRGRQFQERKRITDTKWQVDGFIEFDAKGAPARQFNPYVGATGDCDTMPPANVPVTTYRYDPYGRVLSTTYPGGAKTSAEYGPLVTRFFDKDDNDMTSAGANTPVIHRFDGSGRLIAIERTLAASGSSAPTIRLGYDESGNLATVRDPAGNLKSQTFDKLNRLVSLTDTNAGAWRYEYDAWGNRTKTTDPRGKVINVTYDAAGRVTAEWDPADQAGTQITRTYDRVTGCTECTNTAGMLAEAVWPSGKERYGYDPKSKLLFHERTIDGHKFVVRRQYDGADRNTVTTFPGNIAITRRYDGASRLVKIDNYVNAVEYDDRGSVKSVTFANGARNEFTYNDRLEAISQKTTGVDTTILDLGISRSLSGDITALTDGTPASRPRHSYRATYDGWNRVKSLALDRNSGDPETLTFDFDDLDNVKSIVSSLGEGSRAHVGSLAYDAMRPNAVTTAGSITNTYDAMGSITQRGGLTLSYDYLGRLTQAQRDGAEVFSKAYATGFNRVRQSERDSTTYYPDDTDNDVRDGISNVYVTVGTTTMARAQTAVTAPLVLSDLAPAPGGAVAGDGTIDIADAWLAQANEAKVITLTGATPSAVKSLLASAARRLLVDDVMFLHSDHLGSIIASTDSAGKLRAEQSFYPMGEVRQQTGFVDTYGFTGHEKVEATGLIHAPYRQLDGRTGRWTQADPAFRELNEQNVQSNGQATTGYAYVKNGFTNAVDPLGLAAQTSRPGSSKKSQAVTKGLKIAQLVAALASAAMAIVAVAQAQGAADKAAQAADMHPAANDTAGQEAKTALADQAARDTAAANRLAIGATAVGAGATALGAASDIKQMVDDHRAKKWDEANPDKQAATKEEVQKVDQKVTTVENQVSDVRSRATSNAQGLGLLKKRVTKLEAPPPPPPSPQQSTPPPSTPPPQPPTSK